MENIILFAYISMGFASIFKPMLFLYLFLTIPIFDYFPKALGDISSSLKLLQLGPVNIYLWDYLLLMLAIFFLVNFFKKNERLRATLNSPVSIVIIFLFLWEIFISILSYTKGFELQNILRNLSTESLMFAAILLPLIDSLNEKKENLFHYTVFLSILVIAFAILKYSFNEVEFTSSATQRTLTDNAVIILIFPLCYLLYYSRFWHRHNWLTLLFIGLTAIGIHFAGHRSGWIMFLFVTGIWFVFQQQKIQLFWVPLWSIAVAVILVMFAISVDLKAGTPFSDFFIRIADTVDTENATTKERLSKWKYSLDIIGRNPFLGLGRFPVYTLHIDEDNIALAQTFSELNRNPHNLIATKAIHEGLLGLSVLAIFFIVIFKQLDRAPREDKSYCNFLKVFIIAFLIYSLFNPVFSNETGRIYLFTTLGLLNANILKHAFTHDRKNLGNQRRAIATTG